MSGCVGVRCGGAYVCVRACMHGCVGVLGCGGAGAYVCVRACVHVYTPSMYKMCMCVCVCVYACRQTHGKYTRKTAHQLSQER